MRILFIYLFCCLSSIAYCQQIVEPEVDTTVKLRVIKDIPYFIDSLRQKILSDTSKFKKEDLVNSKMGRINKNSYSPLFSINYRYLYKLDIIEGNDVLIFLNEMLKSENIATISVFENQLHSLDFGEQGINGVVIIYLKGTFNPNYSIAGFKPNGNGGNNFY